MEIANIEMKCNLDLLQINKWSRFSQLHLFILIFFFGLKR